MGLEGGTTCDQHTGVTGQFESTSTATVLQYVASTAQRNFILFIYVDSWLLLMLLMLVTSAREPFSVSCRLFTLPEGEQFTER